VPCEVSDRVCGHRLKAFITSAGTRWPFEARGRGSRQDVIDERRDDRPLAPDGEARQRNEPGESIPDEILSGKLSAVIFFTTRTRTPY
jgi:hypothetical protein